MPALSMFTPSSYARLLPRSLALPGLAALSMLSSPRSDAAELSPARSTSRVARPGASAPRTVRSRSARGATRLRRARPALPRANDPLPPGSAEVLALLGTFADGRAKTPLQRTAVDRLASLPNARALAQDLVGNFRALGHRGRHRLLPGIRGRVDVSRRSPFVDLSTEQLYRGSADLPAQVPGTVQPMKVHYAGLRCTKRIESDANGDEPQVYAALVNPNPYGTSAQGVSSGLFPPTPLSGVIDVGSGPNATGAGPIPNPSMGGDGVVLVSALLEDDGGTTEQERQQLDLLIEAAQILTPTISGEDRLAAFETALQYSLALLRVQDPERWTEQSVQLRPITWDEYGEMWTSKSKVMGDIDWKIELEHDTGGGQYTVYYDVPIPDDSSREVTFSLEEVTLLGPDKDPSDDGELDATLEVSINHAPASKTVSSGSGGGWSISRMVFDEPVYITVTLVDTAPVKPDTCFLTCNPIFLPYDIDPDLEYDATCVGDDGLAHACKLPDEDLRFFVDPNTGTITGDVSGKAGQTLTAAGTTTAAPDGTEARAARVKFKVSVK